MSTQQPSASPDPDKDAIISRLLKETTRDSLTGAYNARYFRELFSLEAARAQRYKVPVSLLIGSVDNLRWVNDTFGHLIGDSMLKAVTKLIENATREVDVVCRTGGNELAIILPHTELHGASLVGGKLKNFIEKFHLPVAKSGSRPYPRPDDLRGVAITMTFGVGQYQSHESSDSFIARVQQTLYRAKKNGDDSDEGLLGVPVRV